jgi:hypothetical protein
MRKTWTVLAVGVLVLAASGGRAEGPNKAGSWSPALAPAGNGHAAAAPAAPAAPPAAPLPGPVVGPVVSATGCGCAGHGHHGGSILEWLTYCPQKTPCHHGCCGHCSPRCDPPLYLFFLDNCTLPHRPEPVFPMPHVPDDDGGCGCGHGHGALLGLFHHGCQ